MDKNSLNFKKIKVQIYKELSFQHLNIKKHVIVFSFWQYQFHVDLFKIIEPCFFNQCILWYKFDKLFFFPLIIIYIRNMMSN